MNCWNKVFNLTSNSFRILYSTRNVTYYKQGQEPSPNIREYFYYVDHQGMLFLEDSKMKNFTSCFKEIKFLRFFFSQLKFNDTGRYKEFPFLSKCGKERNFVRCEDRPFVFTNLMQKEEKHVTDTHLAYNHASSLLSLKFEPDKVVMIPETGRVYHPAPSRVGSIGLVSSKLAIEFSKSFIFENCETNPPTHFNFQDCTYILDNDWYRRLVTN